MKQKKNTKIVIFILLMACIGTAVFAACRGGKNKIVGTWGSPEDDSFVFEIYENGYGKIAAESDSIYESSVDMTFKWVYEGDKLTMIPENMLEGETATVTVRWDGDTMLLLGDDGSVSSLQRKE